MLRVETMAHVKAARCQEYLTGGYPGMRKCKRTLKRLNPKP